MYDWNSLEEIDFKVYSGEPKITLKVGKSGKGKLEGTGTGGSYNLDKSVE